MISLIMNILSSYLYFLKKGNLNIIQKVLDNAEYNKGYEIDDYFDKIYNHRI